MFFFRVGRSRPYQKTFRRVKSGRRKILRTRQVGAEKIFRYDPKKLWGPPQAHRNVSAPLFYHFGDFDVKIQLLLCVQPNAQKLCMVYNLKASHKFFLFFMHSRCRIGIVNIFAITNLLFFIKIAQEFFLQPFKCQKIGQKMAENMV